MSNNNSYLYKAILIALALATVLSLAGGYQGARVGPLSVFAICAILAFMINWLAFIPANMAQTEHYYDLTGSLTYLTVIVAALLLSGPHDQRAVLVAALVVIWALRLGTFLFRRISRDGKDDRFDEIKPNALRFFLAWTLQALWVVITAGCALAVITGGESRPIGTIGMLGLAVWVIGFVIEVVADGQKSKFKQDPANQGKFISTGLWSWSRHPNYFGEIVLWFGMAIIAFPVLHGWQHLTLISPIFVYALLMHVSGVNKLEEKADSKWGEDTEYQAYKARTSLLVLRPPA